MKKKGLLLLLTLAFSLFLFPAFVYADESPTPITKLYVNGVDALKNPNTDGWTFDPATRTLTLYEDKISTGYEPEDYPGTYAGIYAEGDLNLVAGNESVNTISVGSEHSESVFGILVAGDLNITGNEICIEICSSPKDFCGISSLGNMTIDGVRITSQNIFCSRSSIGIFSHGQLDIKNSNRISVDAFYAESTIGLLSYGGITLNNNKEMFIAANHAGIISTLNFNVTDTRLIISSDIVGIYAYSGLNIDCDKLTLEDTDYPTIKGGSEVLVEAGYAAFVVYENGTLNNDGTFIPDGTFINIKEPLYIKEPRKSELAILKDEDGNEFQTLVDSWGKPLTEVRISVLINMVSIPAVTPTSSYSRYYPVPYGFSMNDFYSDYDFMPQVQDGYTFYGWSAHERDSDIEFKFSFDQPITSELYVQPILSGTGKCPGPNYCPSAAFTDLDPDLWYHEYIDYVVEHKLMQGVSATQFAPDAPTTRAMLVTILWRLEGSPVVDYEMTFTDLEEGRWYIEAVRWAASEGIVQGYNDLEFGPNDNLERQQIATILFRHAAAKGYDVSFSASSIDGFKDASSISNYAKEAMAWGSESGLIKGYTDGTVQSTKSATRAEIATFLYRFVKMQPEQ